MADLADVADVELLSLLGAALVPSATLPDEITLARLHATLADLEVDSEPLDITTARGRHDRGRLAPVRRRFASRSSIVAASAIAFALTAGVAAAAVATNTLPGPTRAIAYDLGLPVTSPALFRAQGTSTQLHQAILAKDRTQEVRLGRQLIGELKVLNPSDLAQIRRSAQSLLHEIGLKMPTLSSAVTSPITPTDTIPSVTVPSVSVPHVTVPSVSVPSVSVPKVSVPSVSVPHVTVPSATVPSVTVPSVTVPSVTVPSVTLPSVTVPSVTLPSIPSLLRSDRP
jgi:hypothetical protein